MSSSLRGIASRTDHLILDDLDHVEAQLALDGLLVGLWRVDARNGESCRILKRQGAPLTTELGSSNLVRLVRRRSLNDWGWLCGRSNRGTSSKYVAKYVDWLLGRGRLGRGWRG